MSKFSIYVNVSILMMFDFHITQNQILPVLF